MVCLLLALCVLVSYFQVDALLLTFIAKALKGTLGYGYFLAAPALLAVAVIQLRHQGRPVILRTTCTLLVPLLSGMLCHLLLCRTAYELGSGLLPLLRDGLDQYRTVSGDERVYLLELPEARGNTIGARQHPGAAAHRAAANCLAEFLRSVL